jgi:hypothetical protein
MEVHSHNTNVRQMFRIPLTQTSGSNGTDHITVTIEALWSNAVDITIETTFDPATCLVDEIERNAFSGDKVCISKSDIGKVAKAASEQPRRQVCIKKNMQ